MKIAAPLLFACAAALAGCSTPQPVMDQANHTAGLIAQYELALREFDRVQGVAASARLQSIAVQERDTAYIGGHARVADSVRQALGDTGPQRIGTKLSMVADTIGSEAVKLTSASAALEVELRSLLKPLPGTTEKTTAAQKAVAEMGVELSSKARLAETQAFYKVVKAGVDENRKKIKDAQEAASNKP